MAIRKKCGFAKYGTGKNILLLVDNADIFWGVLCKFNDIPLCSKIWDNYDEVINFASI